METRVFCTPQAMAPGYPVITESSDSHVSVCLPQLPRLLFVCVKGCGFKVNDQTLCLVGCAESRHGGEGLQRGRWPIREDHTQQGPEITPEDCQEVQECHLPRHSARCLRVRV